jgi:hypothetical protein
VTANGASANVALRETVEVSSLVFHNNYFYENWNCEPDQYPRPSQAFEFGLYARR